MHTDRQKNAQLQRDSTQQNFDYWLHRPYVDEGLRARLERCNVLLAPAEDVVNCQGPVFPAETRDLLDFLRTQGPPDMVVDACISDDEYREMLQHGLILTLGTIVATTIVAPVVTTLIANYIQKRIDKTRAGDALVRLELITVSEVGSATKLKYEGPASALGDTVSPGLLPTESGRPSIESSSDERPIASDD